MTQCKSCGKWINAKYKLPEKDEYVLIYYSNLDLACEGKLRRGGFYYSDRAGYSKDVGDGCEITHWMPFPKPPRI